MLPNLIQCKQWTIAIRKARSMFRPLLLLMSSLSLSVLNPIPGFFLTIHPAHAAPLLVTETFSLGDLTPAEARILLTHAISLQGSFDINPKTATVRVSDTPERLADVRSKFSTMATSANNVRIDILGDEQDSVKEQDLSIGGTFGTGPNSLRLRGSEQNRQSSRTNNSFVLVRSGQSASFEVSTHVPDAAILIDYGLASGALIGIPLYQTVGSRMTVRPVIENNGLITVEATPEISFFNQGAIQTVSYRTLSTVVTVRDGGTVEIGGFNQSTSDFNRSFFFDQSRRSQASNGSFRLRATIMSAQDSFGEKPRQQKRIPLTQ
jgi:type II secretory pathway component GspD/PulD (secretin)